MPKVLRIINRFNLGGITYNVSYLSRYMPADYETLLIGGPEEASEENSLFIPHQLGLRPTVISEMRRSLNPLSDYHAYKRIKAIIREFKPDIVHTHASKAGAVGRLAAFSCGVPVVVHTFHGHIFSGYFGAAKTWFFKNVERYLASRSSAIVAISAKQKRELTEEYRVCSAEKTVVIPLGFDLERFRTGGDEKRQQFREQYQLKGNEIAIGIIGRLAPVKNHFLFIDAVRHVSDRSGRKIVALIIGDGEMRKELEAYAERQIGNRARVVFTSWIREVDVALAGLDLVCLSSKNEGTPVSLIEAQAAGRFIVSTNVGGIADILHPGCGLLSEPGDTEKYADNLLDAVDNFEHYSAHANAGAQQVFEKFNYRRLCGDMDALYRKLLSNVNR